MQRKKLAGGAHEDCVGERERTGEREKDRARILYYIGTYYYYMLLMNFIIFIAVQNRLRNPFRLINRCSPRIVYEFGRLIEQ